MPKIVNQILLTADELAERLAVSPRTVIEWANAGLIPEVRLSERIRRFDYGEVINAIRQRSSARGAVERSRW